ncbi:MAG: hypothetical protein ACI9KE_001638 [Polyangiales bacterium]|jgi:hypothetical protein
MTRIMALGGVLIALSALALPNLAGAQVAIGDFAGARGSTVRSSIATRLRRAGIELVDLGDSEGSDAEEIAQATSANIVILGRVRRRGRRWTGSAKIYNSAGEELAEVSGRARGVGGLGARLAGNLEDPIREHMGASSSSPSESESESAGPSGARLVSVGRVVGSAGSRVRNQIVRALGNLDGVELIEFSVVEAKAEELGVDLADAAGLAAVAGELGISALMEGRSQRRGRRYTASIEVRDGTSGGIVGDTTFRGRSAGSLSTSARRQAASRLGPLLEQTSAPTPLRNDDGDTDVDADGDADDDDDDDDADEDDDDADEDDDDGPNVFTPMAQLPQAFEVSLHASLFSRKFSYVNDLYSRLRGYELDGGPSITIGLRYYPGSHLSDGWASRFGIDANYERAFGIKSVRGDGTSFATSSQSYFFGLRTRLPFDVHEASFVVGYGGHSFVVNSNQAGGAVENNLPQVPGVDYRFIRLGLEGRFGLGPVRFSVNGAYNIVMDAGGIDDDEWFPLTSTGSIEAGGTVGYQFEFGSDGATVEFWGGVQLRRYYYTTNVRGDDDFTGDPFIAGGILDQFVNYNVGLTWRR